MAERKTSPWVWVAVGCAVVVLIGIAGVVAIGVVGVRWAQGVKQELTDPDARAARAREILHAEALPEGYYAGPAISMLGLMKTVVLADQPPGDDGEPPQMGQRGLIYLEMVGLGRESDELRDYFEGRTDDAEVLRRANINIDASEIVARGSIDEPGRDLLYLVQRGALSVGGHRRQGLTTLTRIDCDGDRRLRLSVWYAPDEAVETAGGDVDLAGTIGDPKRIAAFHAPFRVCPD